MRIFNVVYTDFHGGFHTREIRLEGKANYANIKKTLRDDLDYYKRDDINVIISWQEVEQFTDEESEEFWRTYY